MPGNIARSTGSVRGAPEASVSGAHFVSPICSNITAPYRQCSGAPAAFQETNRLFVGPVFCRGMLFLWKQVIQTPAPGQCV